MDETLNQAHEQDHRELAPLPRGWTYLIHGTDTHRWNIDASMVRVRGLGLSAITLEDVRRDRGRHGEYDTTAGYSHPRTEGAVPVEVRIPFYREDLSPRRGVLPDAQDIKATLSPETLALVGRVHEDRHARVPRDELLIHMGNAEENGRIIQYFAMASVIEQYAQGIEQEMGQGLHITLEPKA